MSRGPRETQLLGAAAAAGVVHTGFSLYWALGGRWLLPTVGEWAVDAVREAPVGSALLLLAVAAVKGAVALIPLLRPRPRRRRLWRGAWWLAAVVLAGYGAVNSVAAWLVLAGAIRPEGGYEREAMIGHAYLWDPLFMVWGLLLAAGLRAGADRAGENGPPPART